MHKEKIKAHSYFIKMEIRMLIKLKNSYILDAPNPIKVEARYKHQVSWKKKFAINKLK